MAERRPHNLMPFLERAFKDVSSVRHLRTTKRNWLLCSTWRMLDGLGCAVSVYQVVKDHIRDPAPHARSGCFFQCHRAGQSQIVFRLGETGFNVTGLETVVEAHVWWKLQGWYFILLEFGSLTDRHYFRRHPIEL